MKSIDISIIIPMYNMEKYIEECLNSVINQTKTNIEIIVIDDGSLDNSGNIVKKYKDDRIKYFKNKNQGIGKTRNFGIEKANGKYIMFLDSDDYYERNICEELFNKLEKDNLDIVVCDIYKVFDKNKIEYKYPDFKNTSVIENPNVLFTINKGPSNKMFRTSLIKDNNIRFEEDLKYEDTTFIMYSLDKAKKIGKVNKCLYNYRVHENSETTIRDERCFDILKIVMKVREYFKDKDYSKEDINKWTVWILTNYTIQQRYQSSKNIANRFIDEAFDLLEKEVPDYKNNKYYEGRGIKRIIEKNKIFTKVYCTLYRLIK